MRVIFNFPHVGGSQADDVKENQDVLSSFFHSVQELIAPPSQRKGAPAPAKTGQNAAAQHSIDEDIRFGGQVHVALRTTPFYASWDITRLAKEQGLRLLRTEPFYAADYPGYQEQRTQPGVMRALPPSSDGALIYVFVKDPRGPMPGMTPSLKRKRAADGEEEEDEEKEENAKEEASKKPVVTSQTIVKKTVVSVKSDAKAQEPVVLTLPAQTKLPRNTPMYDGKPVSVYTEKSRAFRLGVKAERTRLKALGVDTKGYTDKEIAEGIEHKSGVAAGPVLDKTNDDEFDNYCEKPKPAPAVVTVVAKQEKQEEKPKPKAEPENAKKKKKGEVPENQKSLRNFTDPFFNVAPTEQKDKRVRVVSVLGALKKGEERDAEYKTMKRKERETLQRKEMRKAAVMDVDLSLFDVTPFRSRLADTDYDRIGGKKKRTKNRG
jgi:hypothetical protein